MIQRNSFFLRVYFNFYLDEKFKSKNNTELSDKMPLTCQEFLFIMHRQMLRSYFEIYELTQL